MMSPDRLRVRFADPEVAAELRELLCRRPPLHGLLLQAGSSIRRFRLRGFRRWRNWLARTLRQPAGQRRDWWLSSPTPTCNNRSLRALDKADLGDHLQWRIQALETRSGHRCSPIWPNTGYWTSSVRFLDQADESRQLRHDLLPDHGTLLRHRWSPAHLPHLHHAGGCYGAPRWAWPVP